MDRSGGFSVNIVGWPVGGWCLPALFVLGLMIEPLYIRGFKNFASTPCPSGGFLFASKEAHLLSVFYSLDVTDSFSPINSNALHSFLRIPHNELFNRATNNGLE